MREVFRLVTRVITALCHCTCQFGVLCCTYACLYAVVPLPMDNNGLLAECSWPLAQLELVSHASRSCSFAVWGKLGLDAKLS